MNIKIIVNNSDRKAKAACYNLLIDKYRKSGKDPIPTNKQVDDSANK
ncbi:hypothetical protein [Paenibacillus sp. R14(2021)]|nr:hypothetical protein [Paenibacillus sp. R14(2021)]